MVNLWGPGSFFCARPAASRPSLTPENGAGAPDDWFKDCTSAEARDGTELRAGILNALLAQLRGVVRTAGSVPATNLDDLLLAKAMASGHATYAVATGTANAWTVAPALAVPAYAAGRVLNIIAPATNTSTTVNADISTLGNRRIKKADGTDPRVGDLVSGTVYATIDDGTSIRILTPLPSDRLAQPYLGFHGDPLTLSIPNNAQTLVSGYTGITNNLPGASHTGGVITIGTTGFYQVTANMQSLLSDYVASNYGASITVSKVNGSNVPTVSVAACPIEVLPSNLANSRAAAASGIAKLTAGDRIAAFFAQNRGSAQNVSISLDVEFRGV